MITSLYYYPGFGYYVTLQKGDHGMIVCLPEHWNIHAMANHLREIAEYLL